MRLIPATLVFLGAMFLAAGGAVGQTLSLVPRTATEYAVDGAPAAGSGVHVLQASPDLRMWVDVKEGVSGVFSHRFNPAGSTERYFRLVPTPEEAPPIRVVMIGDSTASDICGWGQGIYGYFKPNAQVINYAYPWTSTRVFLRSAEMDKMVAVKPDYVLMQFGYVDANSLDTTQTTTLAQYAENLRIIIRMVRGWNGTPILITLHAPRAWDNRGNVIREWADRSVAVRSVAAEMGTPLVDLHEMSVKLYSRLGPVGSKVTESECFPGETMHFSLKGGEVISQLVVGALPPLFGPYLTGKVFEPQL